MDQSEISELTHAAYRAAHYAVLAPQPLTLILREFSQPLAELFARHDQRRATYISAWNPLGFLVFDKGNDAVQPALKHDIQKLGLPTIEAFGRDPKGHWPSEESLLVLGLSLIEAKKLGSKYQQNALVWVGLDVIPELIVVR